MEESLKLMIEYSISPLYQWTTNIINYPLRLPSWLKSEYPMKLNPIQKYSDVNDNSYYSIYGDNDQIGWCAINTWYDMIKI